MTLADYLTEQNLTLDAFGRRVGRSAATISRIARGLHRPDWETMDLIQRETDGRVTPNDYRATDREAAA